MSNKIAIIQKIGYTAGTYGCTGEYFSAIILNGNNLSTIHFVGMYGAEDRIQEALKQAGFTVPYLPSFYGKLTRKDVPSKAFASEQEAIKRIRAGVFNNWEELPQEATP